jgi:hypothetical protein
LAARLILDATAEVGFIQKGKDGVPIPGEGGLKGWLKWLALNEPKVNAGLVARAPAVRFS